MHGEITFYVLAGIAILSAAMVVTRRKAFYGSLYFGLSLLASSGIFLQLYAPLLFVAQLVAIACGSAGNNFVCCGSVHTQCRARRRTSLETAGRGDCRHAALDVAYRIGSAAESAAAAGRESNRAVASRPGSFTTARGGADEIFLQ